MSAARRGGIDEVILLSGGLGDPLILAGTVDPTAGGGVAAPEGSTFHRYAAGAGELYIKTGAANTAWSPVQPVHAFGGIYVDNGAVAQSGITTPVTLTGFTTAYAVANQTVPAPGTDTIQVLRDGTYELDFHISFSGTPNSTWTIQMYDTSGPTIVPGCGLRRKLSSGGDVGDASMHGLVGVSGAPVTFDIRASTDAAPSGSLTPVFMSFVMQQVA